MTNDFYILGTFVNASDQRMAEEDITPQTFKKFTWNFKSGDTLNLHINSVGGDVYSGISIANMIRELRSNGVNVICTIDGLAASIASVVACACDKIRMYKSSFMMVHNCWSVVQGNSAELRKEADVMDKINQSIKTFYKSKFALTDDQIQLMMDEETWIQGSEAKDFCLDAEIVPETQQVKIAAQLRNMSFKNIPKGLTMEEKKEEEETNLSVDTEQVEEVEEKKDEVAAVISADIAEIVLEEAKDIIAASPDFVTKAEVDKRVSGMQSTMQAKINELSKSYEAQIADFKSQLAAKCDELSNVKAELTSANTKLQKAEKELQDTVSALAEKKDALAKLNANVLTPHAVTKDDWKQLRGQQLLDWVKDNPELVKQITTHN